MDKILDRGKRLIFGSQESILSAASVIMLMLVVSQVLGVVRQIILLHFFSPAKYAIFLAAFRLPDLVFEVFAFGAFSAAFIPVFTATLKKGEKEAWDVAAKVINIGLIFFGFFAVIFGFYADFFYKFAAPGFSDAETHQVASLARILFISQGIFIVSYVLTGVLESLKRFLIPALAPVMYNLGIILGTVIFTRYFGLYAPVIGVVIGAFLHLCIQLPFATKLGFRFKKDISLTPEVKKIGKLAAPRIVELSFMQILKTNELMLSSLVTTASYTYLSLAYSLQAVPISLFGVALGKAALPTLARFNDDNENFKRTFISIFNQLMFIVIPVGIFISVLRIPIVRMVYGISQQFDWEATIQTSLTLSAFALGIPFQAAIPLLSRSFYAKHDTKTPVVISIIDVVLTIILQLIFLLVLKLPIWSIALANTIACIIQVSALYVLLLKKTGDKIFLGLRSTLKNIFSAAVSGVVMFLVLKIFDESVWVKKLSFLSNVDIQNGLIFRNFVLDTRYTFNLVILTVFVSVLGIIIYLALSVLLKSDELYVFAKFINRFNLVAPQDEKEVISAPPTTTDGNS
ncbi:MAG: murein biosynthesis integral membrane protein MurJ [Patescibacteria group bacterium]